MNGIVPDEGAQLVAILRRILAQLLLEFTNDGNAVFEGIFPRRQ